MDTTGLNLAHPYLTRQLIAYIGNKRRLLPLIAAALPPDGPAHCPGAADAPLFVDFFAGSGAVSRLAKLAGYRVLANDWEPYSRALCRAFLGVPAEVLPELFAEYGGIAGALDAANALVAPSPAGSFFSRLYAPRATAEADPERERLFYTRENALRLDAIREWIEEGWPGEPADPRRAHEKALLLGLLLYEAATHANTSGVFKAFHRGFGGRKKDALSRIMGRIELECPELLPGTAETTGEDALALACRLAASGREIAVAYLDPPYNQHQYGSNYHILNSLLAREAPGVAAYTGHGAKAGIPPGWMRTRSDYCSGKTALAAFRGLVGAIRARHLLVSYSTEGIIPLPEMLDTLGGRGRLGIVMAGYTRFRGGKQDLAGATGNVEFVITVDCAAANRPADTAAVCARLDQARLGVYLKRPTSPRALLDAGFAVSSGERLDRALVFHRRLDGGMELQLELDGFRHMSACRLHAAGRPLSASLLGEAARGRLLALLERTTAIGRDEELATALSTIRYHLAGGAFAAVRRELGALPRLLAKFNDRSAYAASLTWYRRVLRLVEHLHRRHAPLRRTAALERLIRLAELKLTVPERDDPPGIGRQRAVLAARLARLARCDLRCG